MNDLMYKVRALTGTDVAGKVEARVKEFHSKGNEGIEEVFKELCFCVTTANCAARKCWDIQGEINDGYLKLGVNDLEKRLRSCGYRFPNRAPYIVEARGKIDELNGALDSLEGDELRGWLVASIKGLGFKEASHFLRNIGYTDYAIIDFHIIDVLVDHEVIEKPKGLSKKKYMEIEEILREMALKLGLSLSELDLYLWYMETGEVLK